jgi:hypothetical protein
MKENIMDAENTKRVINFFCLNRSIIIPAEIKKIKYADMKNSDNASLQTSNPSLRNLGIECNIAKYW